MKITIRSWFGAELQVIENVNYTDMSGMGDDMCRFSIKNKSFDIETTNPRYFKDVLYDRLKEGKDINFFVVGNEHYKLLAFYQSNN
ncbi:hypothetical protein O3885_10475 [Fusobacterium sp. 27098_8_59]|jgi:hypothetical protein|uniref:hypothetical protein n=1 Tax=Fusobacterium sp. 27098_8_59 TaxID=3003691 RepID=UPI00206B5A3F|nr:MAG TPA: hypothetical protein [Caudoviricetes sp.]